MFITAVTDIDTLLLKWDKVQDNAKYLDSEHRYKEKEYGIKWRTAYEQVLQKHFSKLVKKFGNPLESSEDGVQPDQLEVIAAVVMK